jgi:hypothetical protein
MRKLSGIRPLIGALCVVLLAACGGGEPAVVNSAWNLRAAYITLSPKLISTPLTYLFNVSGSVGQNQIAGTGSLVMAPHVAGTFESGAASKQDSSLEAVYTVGDTPPTTVLASTITNWYSQNNSPFGETRQACANSCSGGLVSTQYIVYGTSSATSNLPTSASSGATGTLYTGSRYSDSTKTTLLGTITATYVLTGDGAGNANFDVSIVERDTANPANQTAKRVMRYVLDQNDAITLKGLSVADSAKDINFVVR